LKYYLILLIAIFLFAVVIKLNIYENSRKGHFIPFTNVNAFHYYFAKEVAEGRGIKARETNVQYPEGMKVFKKESIFMEYAAGYLYRGLKRFFNIPFDDFARHIVRIFSSLTIFAVYLVTYEIYKSRLAGLVSSAFYSVSLPAITRSVGFGFLRENWALPIIFFQFLFFMMAIGRNSECASERRNKWNIRRGGWLYMSLVSGVLMFVALASWHFSQFYLVLIEGFILMRLIFNRGIGDRLVKVFSILLAFGLAASILIPYLAANRFIISIPMLIGYAIVGGWFLSRWLYRNFNIEILRLRLRMTKRNVTLSGSEESNLRYMGMFLITFLVLIILAHPYQKDNEVYSHVYSMGIYQLKYLGMSPADPSKVPFDAKLLWEASHGSPNWKDAISNLAIPSLVALLPILFMIRSIISAPLIDGAKEGNEKMRLLIWFLVISFILYLFVNRLIVFLAFFLSIFAGGLICRTGFQPVGRTGVPPVTKKWIKVVSVSFVLLALMAEVAKASIGTIDVREGLYTVDTLRWLNKNTNKEDVILAPPRSSPEILAYTGRPIVLHAKLESKEIRDKTKRWAESLFVKDEEKLYGLCKEWGVRYFVYPIGTYSNTGPSSWSYITNNVHKDKEDVGYKLELIDDADTQFGFEFGGKKFTGELRGITHLPDLKHFLLVYRNRFFNIYEVR